MINKYHLWLDESGEFEKEASLKEQKRNPSLIGGLLVPEKYVSSIPFKELIGGTGGHACEMHETDKKNTVLPALERLKTEYEVRQVFFENTEYEDDASNRQLYLRMMAEGLLQLLQTLNATSESVHLSVTIAQRQDMRAHSKANRRINEGEYISALHNCMRIKREERKIILHEDTRLDIVIKVAHQTVSLQLADFACNTRLTRKCNAFKGVKNRVYALYDDAYLFTMHELGTENYIKQALSHGSIADAILEVYTTRDKINRLEKLDLILKKIKTMGYRLLKSQLTKCGQDIIAYASQLDDFESGESLLLILNDELVPFLKENDILIEKFHFSILLTLSDMFLREGDIVAAKKSIDKLKETHFSMDDSLENVFTYYQLLEKQALLAINSFDYETAVKLMDSAGVGFMKVMDVIKKDSFLQQRFPNLKSEYLGDALCMQIYAMLFLQRRNPDQYHKLCELSDWALCQYGGSDSELERHRQYRCHIACEAHLFEEAIQWLFKSKSYYVEEVSMKTLTNFLTLICESEWKDSCQYYLMYYLHVMSEAKLKKDPLADLLYKALKKQKQLLRICELSMAVDSSIVSSVDIKEIKEIDTGIAYHPMEILRWKFATYLLEHKQYSDALEYYNKAIDLCEQYTNYHTMRITGVSILAEKIVCLIDAGRMSEAVKSFALMKKRINHLIEEPLQDETLSFILELSDLASQAKFTDTKGCVTIDRESTWKLARAVTY